MTIRVGPTEKQPTHHVKLTDRDGNSVGLILCNDRGEPQPMYNKTPVERTALKTTSGANSYADFNYPYAPIIQDDWSGGRGNLDFERDSARYYDSYTLNTRHENKASLGMMPQFSKGYKANQWDKVTTRYNLYFGFNNIGMTPATSITTARIWVYAKKNVGATVGNITVTIALFFSPFTVVGTGTLYGSRLSEVGQWIPIDIAASLTGGTSYKITTSGTGYDQVKVMHKNTSQSTIGWSFMYALEPAVTDRTCSYYEYKGQLYKVLSPATGAPTVWMNGDRGTADSNAGQLDRLIDATKAWATSQWNGCIVKIVQGTGETETVQYRRITATGANYVITDTPWVITHDTTTEYVILGSDTWQELTGHGLTGPVTSVLVVDKASAIAPLVYFAQGDAILMRSYQGYTSAGAWTSAWRAETASYATHLAYQPLANKIWKANNNDASGYVSVSSASPVAYGTDLTFGTAINVGGYYEFINALEVYPNDSGIEALWVYKEELAYVVTTQAEGIKLDEMRYMRSRDSGKANTVHNVYSYFSLGNGLQRYYGGSIDSVGPNLDEGLPGDDTTASGTYNRRGKIVKLIGYPGRVFAAIDAGADNSSVLERSGSGWHEVYRAPYGERIRDIHIQVLPGNRVDRLWIWQGDISFYITIPSQAGNELNVRQDSSYDIDRLMFKPDGGMILSRMHAGMYDTQKIIKSIQIWAENLLYYSNGDGYGARHIDVDYRLSDDSEWTELDVSAANPLTGPPITRSGGTWDPAIDNAEILAVDLTQGYGLAGKSIQLRLRFFTSDNRETPVLKAVVVQAVMRSQVKYMYNLTFRVQDDEPSLTPRTMDEDSVTAASQSAMTKLAQIEAWADADTEGLLYMESNSPLYNGKYVFINPPVTRQIALDPEPARQWTGTAYVVSTTCQEA